MTIDGYSINVDFRDAEYQDGGGDGGFGTNYSTADLEVYYNATNHNFYRDGSFASQINGTIAIWEDSRKSTINKIPITIKANADEALVTLGSSSNNVHQEKWLVGSGSRTVSVTSPQTQSGVTFTFSSWSDGGAQTHTISPTSDKFGSIVTANFTPKPSSPSNIQAQGTTGQNPHLTWSIHPSTNVSYQIWRTIKPINENTQAPVLLATLSRSTLEYTDYDILITSSYLYDLVSYDVRSVYNLNGTSYYSDPTWYSYFGVEYKKGNATVQEKSQSLAPENKIETISITSHPNPFNPTTIFTYQLPASSNVSLKVFDSAGKEIAILVDASKGAGTHTVAFNGEGLSSGVYYGHFNVQPQDGGKRFTQTLKILLAK